MSSVYLVVALSGTFAAVVLLAVALELSMSDRRKAIHLLQTQVGEVSDLREQDLARSFLERIVLPLVGRFGALARRITPKEARHSIERRLSLAGSPPRWDAEKVAAAKLVATGLGAVIGLAFAGSVGAPRGLSFLATLAFAAMGFFVPNAVLARIGDDRQKQIRSALPDSMDLLTISVEAGLGFDGALMQVIGNSDGPLAQEFSRLLQEMRLGVPRADAFRHLGQRTDVEELNSFIVAMVQADQFGVSISKVLRAQSRELRTKRRQRAEEQAMRVPIKILFPLIFCILPSLLIVVLGPGAIRIAQNLLGLNP
ncbi:MAG: type II secretion system F family protein [Actinomycetota bacterium]|nr:type II secretion system F family protein [Actinomycetota bacterium]